MRGDSSAPLFQKALRAACQALLDAGQRPTALVIGSDLLAAGVFQILYERRLRVPDDLSVVSYDNTLGPYMAPPLTEAEPPTAEMGRQAVALIVEECQRSTARGRGRGQRVVLQSRLHLRDSARPLDDSFVTPAISSQEGALGG
ncbi:MAG TPA: substrate-binding domain-containing protein [Chloroflexota bacterium]|nr:substrate-binding domain-containing protein [Chloroflexota bacterium]